MNHFKLAQTTGCEKKSSKKCAAVLPGARASLPAGEGLTPSAELRQWPPAGRDARAPGNNRSDAPSFLFLASYLFCSVILLLGALPVNAQQRPFKPRSTDVVREEFSFKLKDFKVDHQAETNLLNILVQFTYKTGIQAGEYPNFIPMAKDVEQFLTNYPNERTYWEIINKELTKMVLDKYPALSSITCEIEVAPSRLHPYTRASRVSRQRHTR